MAAIALVAYALLVYQLLGVIAGHGLMKGPLFGVAPCPTTIFTVGLLLLGQGRALIALASVPLIWCAIGTSAAMLLAIPEDTGLGVAGLLLVLSLLLPVIRGERDAKDMETSQHSSEGHTTR
jgi:hypothetical protein